MFLASPSRESRNSEMELINGPEQTFDLTAAIKSRFRISRFHSYVSCLSKSRVAKLRNGVWDQQSRSTLDLTVIGNCKWDPTIRNVASPPELTLFRLLLILPSMICQQSSALSLLSLFESSLQHLLIMPSITYFLYSCHLHCCTCHQ
jgi:hypothetical protein